MSTPGSGRGRGRRGTAPPNRLHYPLLGQPHNSFETHFAAATAAEMSTPPPRAPSRKGPSSVSSRSSTAVRLQESEIETKEKILALQDEINNAQKQLDDMMSNQQRQQQKLELLSQEEETEDVKRERKEIQLALIDLNADIPKLEKNINRLVGSLEARKEIIMMKGKANQDKIAEGNEDLPETNSSGSTENGIQRTEDWVNNAQERDGDLLDTSGDESIDHNNVELLNLLDPNYVQPPRDREFNIDSHRYNHQSPQSLQNFNLNRPIIPPPPAPPSLPNLDLPVSPGTQPPVSTMQQGPPAPPVALNQLPRHVPGTAHHQQHVGNVSAPPPQAQIQNNQPFSQQQSVHHNQQPPPLPNRNRFPSQQIPYVAPPLPVTFNYGQPPAPQPQQQCQDMLNAYAPPPGFTQQQVMYPANQPIYPTTASQPPPTSDIALLASAIQNCVGTTNKPEKELPYFNGAAADWPMFESDFLRSTAHLPRNEANSINLGRLRKALKGMAEETVHHLLSNPGNVPKIMETLKLRFGQAKYVLDALAEKAKSAPSPQSNKPETIIGFGIAVQGLVTNIVSYGEDAYLNSVDLLKVLVEKLPTELQKSWFNWIDNDGQRKENLECFEKWITIEVNMAYRMSRPNIANEDKHHHRRNRHVGVAAGKSEDNGKKVKKPEWCSSCRIENHHLRDCRKFASFPDADKLKFVKDKKLCFSCFRLGHRMSECISKQPCPVSGCKSHHHKTIHNADTGELGNRNVNPPPPSPNDNQVNRPMMGHASRRKGETLLWYIPVRVKGPNGVKTCHAMLDPGCQVSLLDEAFAVELGYDDKKKDNLDLGWFNGEGSSCQSMHINVEVAGDYHNARYHYLEDARSVDNLALPAQNFSVQDLTKKYPYLSGKPIRSLNNAKPSIVIGGDNWTLCLPVNYVKRGPKMPGAIKTAFGWTVVGPGGDPYLGTRQANMIFGMVSSRDSELTQLAKTFIVNENYGVDCPVVTPRSKDDLRALEILKKTTVWEGERYSTGLLFKDEDVNMPLSKDMAMKRLHLIEKKADRNPEFAKLYTSKFEEYFQKGFLKKVIIDPNEDEKKRWYLPHFFALHPSKKPRLVFDAAAKSQGKSFNDFLHTGPDLLQSLAGTLMSFRKYNYGLTGDITQMFHQVALRPEDQPAQTILYRGMDRTNPPETYQMTVLFFGSACSPCSAIYVKNEHAKKFQSEFPAAVKATLYETYMDDLESGGKTVEETIQLYRDVTKVHESGGFPIGKWCSSSVDVINAIPPELRANGDKQISSKSDLDTEKTLGIFWDQAADQFRFKLDMSKLPPDVQAGKRYPTKREIASFIMSLFDPLGFLTPLKIKGLIVFQQCWKLQIDWDSEVTEGINEKFVAWISELPQINNIGIPRCYCFDIHKGQTQLHIFCDASEEAFSSVAYLRIDMGGSIRTAFVTSRAKVAKLKGLSIPRMELNAALMGARMARNIQTVLGEDINFKSTHLWTDSRTVLCWLNSEHGRFSQYVSNRVNEIIEELTTPQQWKWVPTMKNVADEATRSTKPVQLSSDCRWLNGPEFLLLDESQWPKMPITKPEIDESLLEKRQVIMAVRSSPSLKLPLPVISNFSSWWNLIWKTANWIKSIRVLVEKINPSHVTSRDVRKAELMWILEAQRESFSEEIKMLKAKKNVPKSSKLFECSPKLNEDGIIVMAGRLGKFKKNLNFEIDPIILHGKHPYVQLLIQNLHEANAHQGYETVLTNLRKRFWIVNLRPSVNQAIQNCRACKIFKAKPSPPEMALLPDCRLAVAEAPFTHSGVDLFGPYDVAIGRRTEKRWGVLFTCMTTRAVYIDLVPSLNASDVIDALARFSARRGPPKHLYSDQGTNFKGADREVEALFRELQSTENQAKLLKRNWEWKFNCPAASNMGGSWERMIGLTKKILERVMKEKRPKEYTLLTFLAEAENILNSRPLTFVSSHPDDEDAITPNHLLKLRCVDINLSPGNFENAGHGRKMWKVAQHVADLFWKQWTNSVLPLLNKRPKWHEKTVPVKVGDVVLLVDDQAKRNSWRKGIIIKTFPGKDGIIRVAEVRVPIVIPGEKLVRYAVYKRPVNKMCILDVHC